MPTLSREHRRLLENTVAQARCIAVEGARQVLADQYAVDHHEPWPHMTQEDRALRSQLRAHGRQLGDKRDAKKETQEIGHLVQACAYEHWHRMLFARFLAENEMLLDPEHGVPMALDEVQELAREQGREWMEVAAEMAQRMLLAVFPADDPVLRVQLPPETQQQLEEKLASLPPEIFLAADSLGWVYQFWQSEEKERVNKSEVKIGADELPAVTQLFTEDYMVLFLLENTLGAWWTAKRLAEGKDVALPGHEWTYLRLKEDGSPAAGGFEGWPRTAKELKVLDPCMGSGHFLVFALPILAQMRMEEEGLSLEDALSAVLHENLFGLEIDLRCAQIAAFSLALTAWKLVGEHFPLPEMQLACSGVGPNCTREQWIKLAEEVAASGGMSAKTDLFGTEESLLSEPVKRTMEALYDLFSQAPTLGSLINPANLRSNLFQAKYETVVQLFRGVLNAQNANEDTHEQIIAASGMVKAAALLAGKYALVITNVPYLGRGKQDAALADYCAKYHPDAKADLAACFVDRGLSFANEGGSTALVTPQNWLFLTSYKNLRQRVLTTKQCDFIARLGGDAFQTPMWFFPIALVALSRKKPVEENSFAVWDVGEEKAPDKKAEGIRDSQPALMNAKSFEPDGSKSLKKYASCYQGLSTGDNPQRTAFFWEAADRNSWVFLQFPPDATAFVTGRTSLARKSILDDGFHEGAIRGREAWDKQGIGIARVGSLSATLYDGNFFVNTMPVIIPQNPEHLAAIWSFTESEEFQEAVSSVSQALSVDNGYLEKIPFDLDRWQLIAANKYPDGLPKPHTSDPTQWLFGGNPNSSDNPLQVAVARLAGYQWPRQTGSSFPDCPALGPDGLEKHADADGIVLLHAVGSHASAADRLRSLLADAYGNEWSATKLQELLGEWDSLEEYLRDGFFEEHCKVFQQRPFVWHIWDGRKDGFHALVNYHRLAAANGEGHKTLEKLIYTHLGHWIERQIHEVKAGTEGADARLTAATHLKTQLEKILAGEKPYDLFIRWKPLAQQPIGWEPDINDGVRLNIRPWLTTTLAPTTKPKKGACILRITPKINFGKDRGKEPHRPKEDFPWFWSWDPDKADAEKDFLGNDTFDGARWNDLHYGLETKRTARAKKKAAETKG